VAAAYERLTAEGFLVGKVGAGTYVQAETLGKVRTRTAPGGAAVRPRRLWRDLPPARMPMGPVPYDFRVGMPDPRLFPLQSWRRLVARELRPALVNSAEYVDPSGHAGLREAIARHIGVSRSVRAGVDDVIVTHGAQQAIDLIARVMVDPGGWVAVEEPGYPPVRTLFESLGARVAGVPVDGEGLDVTALPAAARLVYTTPSHQFPLGTTMSLRRRAALLEWADRHDAVVVEDDYDSEFRFADRPLEPLQSIDRFGRVVYVGSFSKTLLPMLRLGFLVAPVSLQPALRAAKQLSDWHSELSMQAALARFVEDGLLARHIRRATREYAGRYELIGAALQGNLARWLVPVPAWLSTSKTWWRAWRRPVLPWSHLPDTATALPSLDWSSDMAVFPPPISRRHYADWPTLSAPSKACRRLRAVRPKSADRALCRRFPTLMGRPCRTSGLVGNHSDRIRISLTYGPLFQVPTGDVDDAKMGVGRRSRSGPDSGRWWCATGGSRTGAGWEARQGDHPDHWRQGDAHRLRWPAGGGGDASPRPGADGFQHSQDQQCDLRRAGRRARVGGRGSG
jgi:GntR family transcriptional regulator/MocR family aminotransferase